jgi:hypothetical protein
MFEIALVVAIPLALGAVALVPWTSLFQLGVVLSAAGLLLGVPTGLVYHLRLRAALLEAGALPPRWWLDPVRRHPAIPEAWRPRVLPWFYAGGMGFVFCALGCLVWLLAVPGSLGWVGER